MVLVGQWREDISKYMESTNGKASRPTPRDELAWAKETTC
jgi:hypothetical protein